jgi:CRP-like cAMP-binding protein
VKPADLGALLPANSPLAGMSPEELRDLLEFGTVTKVRPGQQILNQGDVGDALVLLITGVARVSMIAPNGHEIVLDYAEAGAVIGEIALLDGEPRTASATAMYHGMMLRLSRAGFEQFIERHPRFALRIMREMARRLRATNATIESDRAFAAGPRLARFLKRLTQHKADGHRLAGDLSQSELGNFVGMSRENINRQLAAWADAGIIELAHGKVRILDNAHLSQIAENNV